MTPNNLTIQNWTLFEQPEMVSVSVVETPLKSNADSEPVSGWQAKFDYLLAFDPESGEPINITVCSSILNPSFEYVATKALESVMMQFSCINPVVYKVTHDDEILEIPSEYFLLNLDADATTSKHAFLPYSEAMEMQHRTLH